MPRRGITSSSLLRRAVESSFGIITLASLGIAGIGTSTRSFHIRPEFYAVVAQVIPVFLLVVVVEGRFFRDRKDRPPAAAMTVETLLVLSLFGEACALGVVARGRDSDLLRGGVLGGLLVIAFTFIMFATLGPAPETAKDSDPADVSETRSS